jgi:hypothetical protein
MEDRASRANAGRTRNTAGDVPEPEPKEGETMKPLNVILLLRLVATAVKTDPAFAIEALTGIAAFIERTVDLEAKLEAMRGRKPGT